VLQDVYTMRNAFRWDHVSKK